MTELDTRPGRGTGDDDEEGPAPKRSIWPHVEERVLDLIEQHKSTIVFANSRRLAERLCGRLNELAAERAELEAALDLFADVYEPLFGIVQPALDGRMTVTEALDAGAPPVRDFMLKQTREADLALFVELGHLPRPASPNELPMRAVIPAFAISELKTGFQMGFFLFVPVDYDEQVIAACGLRLIAKEDTTPQMADIAARRGAARAARRAALIEIEGQETFEAQQEFFAVVARLATEGALSRFVYVAERGERST